MNYVNLNALIDYYLTEQNKGLKDKFYKNVLIDIFNNLSGYALKKYNIFEADRDYKDLKQELQIQIFLSLQKIRTAKDSGAYVMIICKNYILNYKKCQTTNFIPLSPGVIYENINYQ